MVDPPFTLSLFSGVGGLDLGWTLATEGHVVGYVERDAYAASVLLARMEDETLERSPIWCGDATELPLDAFLGVDAIIGGFPCQDISLAGSGAGIHAERSGLWGRAFLPAICTLRPRFVFIENVSALTFRGLDTVLADLAQVGFDAEWATLRASAVGAPHRRERVFILAHAYCYDRATGGPDAPESGGPMGHAARERRSEGRAEPARDIGGPDAPESGGPMDHTAGERLQRQAAAGVQYKELKRGRGVFPPAPTGDWGDISESFWPSLERDFCNVADGLAPLVGYARTDALRCVGNGVVALQAAVAARLLLRRLLDNLDYYT